jgi:hypothetical protein
MPVLDVRMWPRWDIPGLGLIDEDVGLIRGVVDCGILTQGLIGLIEYSYHQGIPSFPEAHLHRTLGLSMLGPEQFQDGWPIGTFSQVCTSEYKNAQKRLGLVCGAVRSNDRQAWGCWGVTDFKRLTKEHQIALQDIYEFFARHHMSLEEHHLSSRD